MKRNDWMTVTTVALATATLTVGSFLAVPLEAGNEETPLVPKIARPTLAVKGVEVTLSAVSGTEQAGDEPVFELVAANTSARDANINVQLTMTATSPADALSRVVRLPGRLWQQDQSIVLGPKERKTFTLPTKTRLRAKNLIAVTLREKVPAGVATAEAHALPASLTLNAQQPDVTVLSFSTPGPAAPTLAKAQSSE